MRASRLMAILMKLQTRGRISARVLADELEVSPRTVYRDIDELSAAGVPVVVERGPSGGFELLDGWRTTLTGLTPNESQALLLSGLPGPVSDLGLGETMASAQLKLLAALPSTWQSEARRVSSRIHVDLAAWYRRIRPVEHLRALADAVWSDRRIAIGYESWQGVVERALEPLGLVIKAGDWYLVARRAGGRTPRTYRVASIRSLAVGDRFDRPSEFDLSAFWIESTRRFERDIYRATATVRVTHRGRTLLRIANAAVEAAVELAAERGGDVAWLEVTIPIESIGHATSQLLALGTDVVVLEPAELRARMRDAAREIAKTYRPTRRRETSRRMRQGPATRSQRAT